MHHIVPDAGEREPRPHRTLDVTLRGLSLTLKTGMSH